MELCKNMRERLYIDGSPREYDVPKEKHPSIELSDEEYLRKQNFIFTDNFVKFNKSVAFTVDPPLVEVKLVMPILEKQIKEKGMHPNEKSKSKTPNRKSKKVPTKSNKAAVEKVQE